MCMFSHVYVYMDPEVPFLCGYIVKRSQLSKTPNNLINSHASSGKVMDILSAFTLLWIVLCTLLSHSTASRMEFQLSLDDQDTLPLDKVQLSAPSSLPRKLRFTQEVIKGHDGEEFTSNNDLKEKLAGKEYKKKQGMVLGNRGTWQEWEERGDMSEYFTMDYSPVRRRRPIHNKSIPVRP